MRDNTRVSLSIAVWTMLFIGFVAAGIFGISRMVENKAVTTAAVGQERIERVIPDSVGLDGRDLQRIASLVDDYVERGTIPGAVVAIVRGDKLAYIEAFGSRDDGIAVTEDAHFDLASLTKPVVVATAVMQLVERGELRLSERVSGIIPTFEGWRDAKDEEHDITILDLITHTSKLPAYVSLERLHREYPDSATLGREELMHYIAHCPRELPDVEGASHYSCLNYITLGVIVESIAGMSLEEYAQKNIFEPLAMHNSCFAPTAEYASQCVPTATGLRGVVHDPLAREVMSGISGNAGLFSTAEDMAIFTAMLLGGGSWRGVEVLSPLAVDAMFEVPYGYEVAERTIGWRAAHSVYVAAGDLLAGADTIVHTGATVTSLVVDRKHNIAIVILTNRTSGSATATDIHDLRSKICNIVAATLRI
ncbi:MAG: beta-lactamase family protein [Alistipes sp.]|nr:beta-lactamase family protein [Alistipes sp.]